MVKGWVGARGLGGVKGGSGGSREGVRWARSRRVGWGGGEGVESGVKKRW